MPDIGVPELLIVALVVLLLFGPGRAADLGGALGRSIREFRRESRDEGRTEGPGASPADAGGARAKHCIECGATLQDAPNFCASCGARVGSEALPRAG